MSVVLATHGDSERLFDTLASVLAQEGVELECVVVCDGPLPSAPARTLRELAGHDPRLRVLEVPHGGLTRALIAGCAAARGAAIARVDVGDRMEPQRLQRQLAVLRRHPECVLVSSHVGIHGPAWEPLWVARGAPEGEEPVRLDALPPEEGLAGDVPHHGSVLFRREAYERAGGYRPQFYFAQDWDLWYRLAPLGSYAIVPAVLTRVRLATTGLSSRHWREQRRLARCCRDAYVARCRGGDEAAVLARAEIIRPDRRPLAKQGPRAWLAALRRRGDGEHFIGEALRRRGDPRCRPYLRRAVTRAPWRLVSWLRLLQSLGLSKRPVDPPPRSHLVVVCAGLGGTGSVGAVALRQAGLLSQWARVTLMSDRPRPAAGEDGWDRWIQVRAPRFRWLRRFCHLPAELAFDLGALMALLRLHRRNPVDLVLCHSHPVAALTGVPFRWLSGARLAMVCHGDIFERPAGTYEPGLTWLYRHSTPLAYRQADLVVALSPTMRDWAERGGAPPERLALIPNGIDPADIGLSEALPPPTPEGRGLRVLYVGRIEPVKGVDVLLTAWRQLMETGWAGQLRLVGPVAPAWRAEFERLCEAIPEGPGRPEVLSLVPRLELGGHYRWADVVVIPSRSDPLPTVALEAMAAGRAIVGTRVGGLPFLLNEGQAGILVPPDRPESLARALSELAKGPSQLTELGGRARARQGEAFTWRQTGQGLKERLTLLISGASENHQPVHAETDLT